MSDGQLDAVDAVRALIVSLAGLTIGLALYIAGAYVRSYVALTHDAARRWAPVHVAGFALAHIMYTGYGALVVIERVAAPLSWAPPYLVVANLLSATVLLFAARRERRRIVAAKVAERMGHPLRRRDDL